MLIKNDNAAKFDNLSSFHSISLFLVYQFKNVSRPRERMDDTLSGESEINYPKPFSGDIKFERRNVLGASNSTVYRGTFEEKTVAVKRILKSQSSLTEDREITAQINLDHQNVVKMLTAEQDDDFRY